MRELSLFSGAGGGLLGTLLLGWRPVGYVEWDEYCQRVLRARIDDGYLPVAPIFTDVREFIQSGAAAEYRGFADVVTGGSPCQPFSTAGKRAGADDPRNMWPATIDVIRVVRPRFAFLENVPGLLSSGYFGTILGDLAASGYDAQWRILSAAELGAPHKRDRLWIVANAEPYGCEPWGGRSRQAGERWTESVECCAELPGAHGERQQEQRWAIAIAEKYAKPECDTWWATEPVVGGMAHGLAVGMDGFTADADGNLARVARSVPDRVSRLKALGNGQVPAVVAAAWRMLTERL